MTEDAVVLQGCRYRARWARSLPTWDLAAHAGDVVHLHAPNGTGKSMYLRAAAGVVPARWEHRDLGPNPSQPGTVRHLGATVGVSPAWRVRQHLALAQRLYGLGPDDVAAAVEAWGVTPMLDSAGDTLSLGQHRSVLLAVVLAGGPRVLFLDEPSVGLDDHRQDLLVQRIRQLSAAGSTVVIAAHDRHLRDHLPGRELVHA